MRLIHRHSRHDQRGKAPRIAISQAEITADLIYPATRRHQVVPAPGAQRSATR
jgi:hypothetical protein